jgi:hypothetical protein
LAFLFERHFSRASRRRTQLEFALLGDLKGKRPRQHWHAQPAQGLLVASKWRWRRLLIGGGLMIRSIRALWNIDPGFRSDDLLTFRIEPGPSARNESQIAFARSCDSSAIQFNSVPGVQAASFKRRVSAAG